MASAATRLALVLATVGLAVGVPFGPANKLFGIAEKNAALPPYGTELRVFNHTCASAPCQLTQIHVPSVYPQGKCVWDWENARLRIYVDGDPTPTLNVTLLQLAFVGAGGATGNAHTDVSPFSAGSLFGKNAQTGGVFSTIRVPFGKTVVVTLEQAPSCTDTNGVCVTPSTYAQAVPPPYNMRRTDRRYWVIIRGVEALTLRLAELELPKEARLTVAKLENRPIDTLQFVTLASAPAGTDGVLLATFIDVVSATPSYLEGCFRFLGPNPSDVSNEVVRSRVLSVVCRAPRAMRHVRSRRTVAHRSSCRAAPKTTSCPHRTSTRGPSRGRPPASHTAAEVAISPRTKRMIGTWFRFMAASHSSGATARRLTAPPTGAHSGMRPASRHRPTT